MSEMSGSRIDETEESVLSPALLSEQQVDHPPKEENVEESDQNENSTDGKIITKEDVKNELGRSLRRAMREHAKKNSRVNTEEDTVRALTSNSALLIYDDADDPLTQKIMKQRKAKLLEERLASYDRPKPTEVDNPDAGKDDKKKECDFVEIMEQNDVTTDHNGKALHQLARADVVANPSQIVETGSIVSPKNVVIRTTTIDESMTGGTVTPLMIFQKAATMKQPVNPEDLEKLKVRKSLTMKGRDISDLPISIDTVTQKSQPRNKNESLRAQKTTGPKVRLS